MPLILGDESKSKFHINILCILLICLITFLFVANTGCNKNLQNGEKIQKDNSEQIVSPTTFYVFDYSDSIWAFKNHNLFEINAYIDYSSKKLKFILKNNNIVIDSIIFKSVSGILNHLNLDNDFQLVEYESIGGLGNINSTLLLICVVNEKLIVSLQYPIFQKIELTEDEFTYTLFDSTSYEINNYKITFNRIYKSLDPIEAKNFTEKISLEFDFKSYIFYSDKIFLNKININNGGGLPSGEWYRIKNANSEYIYFKNRWYLFNNSLNLLVLL